MTTELFTISRLPGWSFLGDLKFEIECDPNQPRPIKLGLAVRAAVKSEANLTEADLTEANLTGVNLMGANLWRADLSRADLTEADLSVADMMGANLSRADMTRANLWEANLTEANLMEADLTGANLTGANLTRANLSRADLSRADMTEANLTEVNLMGANLSRADLRGTNLCRADLSRADLSRANLMGSNLTEANLMEADLSRADMTEEAFRPFKADLWATILSLRAIPVEMRHLIAKLRAGQIDGSTYNGENECACLVGTIAQPRKVDGDSLDHNCDRFSKRWFMMIRPGDVPGTLGDDGKETGGAFAARKALEWTLELAAILGVAVDEVAL